MAPQDDKLVERLQRREHHFRNTLEGEYDANLLREARHRIQSQAADKARIEALEAENARLREALKPFAALADDWSPEQNGGYVFVDADHAMEVDYRLRVGDFRRAKTAWEQRNG